jgi:hypothetical protein
MLSRIEGAIATRKAGSTDVAWEVHTRKPQPVNLPQHGVVLFIRGSYSPVLSSHYCFLVCGRLVL